MTLAEQYEKLMGEDHGCAEFDKWIDENVMDFYSTGDPETFKDGSTISQDLVNHLKDTKKGVGLKVPVVTPGEDIGEITETLDGEQGIVTGYQSQIPPEQK